MTTNPILTLEHITAGYEQKVVLRDVNLTVYDRDFLGVIGPNGGGKTTLIKVILGLLAPLSGKRSFFRDGRPTDGLKMGYLPQYNQIDKPSGRTDKAAVYKIFFRYFKCHCECKNGRKCRYHLYNHHITPVRIIPNETPAAIAAALTNASSAFAPPAT